MIDWQFFSYNFTASGANTSLAFFNGIPIGEGVLAGLDNVRLELAVVPEPTMPVLLGIGLLSLVACARQGRWKTPRTSARSD